MNHFNLEKMRKSIGELENEATKYFPPQRLGFSIFRETPLESYLSSITTMVSPG